MGVRQKPSSAGTNDGFEQYQRIARCVRTQSYYITLCGFCQLPLEKGCAEMAFSDLTIRQAWQRSGGRCECERSSHGHGYTGRCTQRLMFNLRGNDYSPYGWEAHHKTAVSSGGGDTLSNCEILCMSCHKKTGSYGRH